MTIFSLLIIGGCNKNDSMFSDVCREAELDYRSGLKAQCIDKNGKLIEQDKSLEGLQEEILFYELVKSWWSSDTNYDYEKERFVWNDPGACLRVLKRNVTNSACNFYLVGMTKGLKFSIRFDEEAYDGFYVDTHGYYSYITFHRPSSKFYWRDKEVCYQALGLDFSATSAISCKSFLKGVNEGFDFNLYETKKIRDDCEEYDSNIKKFIVKITPRCLDDRR